MNVVGERTSAKTSYFFQLYQPFCFVLVSGPKNGKVVRSFKKLQNLLTFLYKTRKKVRIVLNFNSSYLSNRLIFSDYDKSSGISINRTICQNKEK